MNKPETVTEAKRNTLIRAAVGMQQHERTAAIVVEMPGTDPQAYIAVGTSAEIARVLPEIREAAPASHPARRLRRGDRPTEPLSWDDAAPAATSGDAPTDEPVAYMYQDDADKADPGAGSCVITRVRQACYRNETPLYARIERAAAPALDTEAAQMFWDAALSHAAFYVEGHCADGARHAEAIMGMRRPATIRAAAPATASGDELPPLGYIRQVAADALLEGEGISSTLMPCPTEMNTVAIYARAAVSAATKPTAEMSKPWQERASFLPPLHKPSTPVEVAMSEEIADLRSLLATKPTADLKGLVRYEPANGRYEGEDAKMFPFSSGGWVRFADVRSLLATKPAAAPENLVRYCPGCGSVGPVQAKYRDCCPDGSMAREVPRAFAEQCRETFKLAIAGLAPTAAPAEQVREVPSGAAVDGKGTIYYNIDEMYHLFEEGEALHMWLDDAGIPRADAEGKVFSLGGRVMGLAQDALRFRWLNEDHDDVEVREQARSLARRLGTTSYFAITRDIDAAMAVSAPDGAQGEGA